MDVSLLAGKSVGKPRSPKPVVAATGFLPSPPVITAATPLTIGKLAAAALSHNGSHLEHATMTTATMTTVTGTPRLAEKYFDTNIEAPPLAVKKATAGVNDSSNCDTTTVCGGGNEAVDGQDMANQGCTSGVGGGNNYCDSWKVQQEAENTLIFNFINSKKDVSHSENEVLDLTKHSEATNKVGTGRAREYS